MTLSCDILVVTEPRAALSDAALSLSVNYLMLIFPLLYAIFTLAAHAWSLINFFYSIHFSHITMIQLNKKRHKDRQVNCNQ